MTKIVLFQGSSDVPTTLASEGTAEQTLDLIRNALFDGHGVTFVAPPGLTGYDVAYLPHGVLNTASFFLSALPDPDEDAV